MRAGGMLYYSFMKMKMVVFLPEHLLKRSLTQYDVSVMRIHSDYGMEQSMGTYQIVCLVTQ